MVIFLDDLQWIDPASLKLIKAFTDDGIDGSLLFIGAYRTNEVDEKHPVYEIIRSFEDARIPVRHIALDTLSLDTTRELVFDILQCENDSIDLLAKNIFQKSAGNPLYIKQIIQNLYEDGNLYFSSKELRWKCIDYELLNIEVKESVVDYVINRIKKLPADTIDLLKFASCAGKSFYTNDLLNALNQSADWIKQSIKPAVDAGIIIKNTRLTLQKIIRSIQTISIQKGICQFAMNSCMTGSGKRLIRYCQTKRGKRHTIKQEKQFLRRLI